MADQITAVLKDGGMQRFMFMKRYWSEIDGRRFLTRDEWS